MKDDEQQSLFGNGSVVDVDHAKKFEVPTVDMVPVVHAHWECLQPILVSTYECSKCGFDINLNESPQNINRYMKFCPHCGAKMDD